MAEQCGSLGLECRLVSRKAVQLLDYALQQTHPLTVDLAVQPWDCAGTSGDPLALGQVVELGNRPWSLKYLFVVQWESYSRDALWGCTYLLWAKRLDRYIVFRA